VIPYCKSYSQSRNCPDFGPFGSARPIQQMPSLWDMIWSEK
jgi:hypothetical protein